MCRILEKNGWVLRRIRGSHHIYGRDDDPEARVVVPVQGNRNLKLGLQRRIMKDSGLSEDDL
jgi:predicted RNA binding protein YcfA (HicA-like mRNA interferase family)